MCTRSCARSVYVSWSGGADATSVVCEETREGVSGVCDRLCGVEEQPGEQKEGGREGVGVCDGVRFGRSDTGERKKGRWGTGRWMRRC